MLLSLLFAFFEDFGPPNRKNIIWGDVVPTKIEKFLSIFIHLPRKNVSWLRIFAVCVGFYYFLFKYD